jgi:hypothetical protein
LILGRAFGIGRRTSAVGRFCGHQSALAAPSSMTLSRHPRSSLQAFIRGLKGFGSPARPLFERDRQRPKTAVTALVGFPSLKSSRQARKPIVCVGEARPHRMPRKAFANALL